MVLALALALAACGGNPFAAPTPTPQPLTVPELKYRLIDEVGRPWFCDPDFYPVARADEGDVARQRFPELQQDAEAFRTIVARLKLANPAYTADEQLAIYREWKTLNALQLQTVNDAWAFAYLAQKTGGTGERVDGRVSVHGRVTVLSRTAAGPPPCPICLALGTRVATPSGAREVQDLRIGDVVWTIDAAGARIAAPLVTVGSTPVPTTHEVVRLMLEDGRIVRVSPGHPTTDGRRVGDLAAGDALDGARITSVQRVAYADGATYDILPAGTTGAYWANGVLLGSTLRTPHYVSTNSRARNFTIRP
ncbi:MAG: Hint domain-containing protein [Chloroflexota bacterium]